MKTTTFLSSLALILAVCPVKGKGSGYSECTHNKYQATCMRSTSPLVMEGRGISIFPQLTNRQDCLKLARNSISSFPDKLDPYEPVVTLDLSDNRLSRLPDDLNRLANLEILDLSRNSLLKLSPTIRFPASLRGLLLAGNGMKTLPDGIKIPGLFVLDLSNNLFTQIPTGFCVSDQLIRVDFTNNKLTPDLAPHIDVIGSCPNANGVPFCMFTDIDTLDCKCSSLRPMFDGQSVFSPGLPSGKVAGAVVKCDKQKSESMWKSQDLYDVNVTEVRNSCSWASLTSNRAPPPHIALIWLLMSMLALTYSV